MGDFLILLGEGEVLWDSKTGIMINQTWKNILKSSVDEHDFWSDSAFPTSRIEGKNSVLKTYYNERCKLIFPV